MGFEEVHGSGKRDGSYRYAHTGTSHNIQSGEPRGIPVRLLPVPPRAVSRGSCNSTPATESGESFAHRITDPHAAEPVGFHPSRLVGGQQGIGHELILVEDGVVEAHRSMIAGDAT
jgi:hypothetical protein